MKTLISNFFVALIAMVLVIGVMVGMYFLAARELATEVDYGTVVYNEGSDTSSLTANVKIENSGELYGIVVKDFSYIIRFADADGKTLYEELIVVNDVLKREPYEKSIKFGTDGDYAAVSGRVENVTVEVTSAKFMNLCQYAVEYEGENFGDKVTTRALLSLGAFVSFMLAVMFLEFASGVDNLIGKLILWALFIGFSLLFGYLFYHGMRYFIIWILPNF